MKETPYSRMLQSLKILGKDEMYNRYRKFAGGGYQEAIQVGKYKVEYSNDSGDTRIMFYHPTGICINMVISKYDDNAVLDFVNYHPDCTSPEKMKRGDDTREMVEFAFSLLREEGCKKVELTDASTIQCGSQEVKLGQMFFLKYGMTWYEKHFGFQPFGKYAGLFEKAREER